MKEHLAQIGHAQLCPVVVIERGGKILMGRRHYTPDKWKAVTVWTLPGGRCDEGECIEDTLRRETMEETGITDLSLLDFIGDAPGAKAGDMVRIFYGTTSQEPQLMEPEKFSEWRWFPRKAFLEDGVGEFNPAAQEVIRKYLLSL